MANYFAKSRSNYFRVRSQNRFEEFCSRYGLILLSKTDPLCNTGSLFGFALDDRIPDTQTYDVAEMVGIDFLKELAEHLADGEVAVLMEIGNEKMRFLNGYACAINSLGEHRELTLAGIYEIAQRDLGRQPTRAEF